MEIVQVYRHVRAGDNRAVTELSFGSLPPKLGHIPGCLAFSEKHFGKKQKKTPKSLFEKTLGNSF